MTIERQLNADKLNEIANHSDVYPWVCGALNGQPLDLSPLTADLNNVVLANQTSAMVFHHRQTGLYDVHTLVLPEGRGRQTIEFVNTALHWMFTRTGAVELVSRVPDGNIPAKALVNAIHGSCEFRLNAGWFKDGRAIPADIYSLTIQNWMKTAPGLEQRGQWFHDRLEQEYKALGASVAVHEDDPVHDRYVGAAVDMIMGGQSHKGVVFYNRWAVMADYQPIEIVTEQPLFIDIRDAVIGIRNNDFWVVECQLRQE